MSDVCRFCGHEIKDTFADLGLSPLANEYVSGEQLQMGQHYYPLHVKVCRHCYFVQTMEYKSPESIFRNYQYFSSYSTSWVEHARKYVDMIIKRKKLSKSSLVAEVACNDGYLLQFFVKAGIPCYGVEPAENVAVCAEQMGITVYKEFFSDKYAETLANEGKTVDLLIGNNVMAHVPDINSFLKGINIILKPDGIATFEFPHIMNLIIKNQFDTIYHEHFSYLSLIFLCKACAKHGLKIIDVEELSTHGGSLRVYIVNQSSNASVQETVENVLTKEKNTGLNDLETYISFSEKVKTIKRNIVVSLSQLKSESIKIAAYGAAAKGNTLLNYCGIGKDMIDFVVDANPYKQGLYLPGTQIPIVSQEYLVEHAPDYLIILPWNLKEEIIDQLNHLNLQCKFITLIPDFKVVDKKDNEYET